MINNKMPKMPLTFECKKCTFICFKKSNYNIHLLTSKHQMITNDNPIMPTFECKKCAFLCIKQSNYANHLLTSKHIINNKMPKNKEYMCECGKEYLYHSGLCRHKKICTFVPELTPEKITEPMIMDIIKQNQVLQKQILELANKPQIVNNTSSKFNLNFFLNEQCKDALNITDFINSLHMQLKDLENFEVLGYVQNISNIFIRGLKSLDICKRPIHCSDLKREVLYVKDQDSWEKDTAQITTAIKKITHKNIRQLPIWEKENPSYIDIDHKKNDQHMKIVYQVMGGLEEDEINYNKIIKNVMKETTIGKT